MTYQIYNDPEYQHVKNEIYDRIINGEHVEDIKQDLIERFGFKKSTLDVYCVEVYALFNEGIENQRDNIIALHINRHDAHYSAALSLALEVLEEDENLTDIRNRQNFYRYLNEALDALEDKENMLNMRSKKFNYFIKEQVNNVLIHNKRGVTLANFDLEKLNFSEKMELLSLLSKSEVKTIDVTATMVKELNEDAQKINDLKTFEEKEVEDVDLDEEMTFSKDQIEKIEEKEPERPHSEWEVAQTLQKSYADEIKKLDQQIEEQRKMNKKLENNE